MKKLWISAFSGSHRWRLSRLLRQVLSTLRMTFMCIIRARAID